MGEKNPNSQTGANFTNRSKFHKPEQISQMGAFFCFFLFVSRKLKGHHLIPSCWYVTVQIEAKLTSNMTQHFARASMQGGHASLVQFGQVYHLNFYSKTIMN